MASLLIRIYFIRCVYQNPNNIAWKSKKRVRHINLLECYHIRGWTLFFVCTAPCFLFLVVVCFQWIQQEDDNITIRRCVVKDKTWSSSAESQLADAHPCWTLSIGCYTKREKILHKNELCARFYTNQWQMPWFIRKFIELYDLVNGCFILIYFHFLFSAKQSKHGSYELNGIPTSVCHHYTMLLSIWPIVELFISFRTT